MIKVRFSCLKCGLRNQLVDVPARESPNVDVAEYIRKIVASKLGQVHRAVSPLCTSEKMDFLALPMDLNDPDAWVGKQTDQVPPELDDTGAIKP